jgi:hypothetical protein
VSYTLCLLACAKKLPPPNTDRFAPSLQDVSIVNQSRIDLIFDEGMKRSTLKPEDFPIVSSSGETLGLLAVTPSADPTIISLLTRRQSHVKYVLQGTASDTAGNVTRFTFRFMGSNRPDSIPPAITNIQPHLNSTKTRKGVTVRFTFSKIIDTLSYGGFIVLPPALRARFTPAWDPSLTGRSFAFADSLGPDTTVSVIMLPLFRDFSGNHPVQAAYTSFTSDSLPPPKTVKGRVVTGGRPPRNALVVLEQDAPLLVTVVRSDGSFIFHARNEAYSALAVADTNYDGYVDLVGHTARAALPESLIVQMEPETTRVRVESLF